MRLIVALLIAPSVALAQPADPTGEPAVPPADPPAPAPTPDPPPAVAPAPMPTTTTTVPTSSTTASGTYAGATAPPPGHWRLMLSDLSIFRLNPLGLETRARLGLQKRLYPSQKLVSQNNFVFLGAYPKLNPASAQVAFGGEIQPLSIFNVRANVEVGKFFGTFGFLQSFSTPSSNYSDQTLKDLRDDVPGFEPQTASFIHAAIYPTLQARIANKIAIRSMFQLDYWDFKLRSGDTVAYEATVDTLIADKGITLATDTDVLFVGKPGLAIGLRHTWVKPIYKRKHFADPDLSADENAAEFDAFDRNGHQRLGLFAAYTLHDRGPSTWNKPTIILVASWYLNHNYRTGTPDVMLPDERAADFTSSAFPYFLLGFAFESDLAGRPRP